MMRVKLSRFSSGFLLMGAILLAPPASAVDENSGLAAHLNYLNGGIGREEVEAMRLQAKHFSLQVLFSQGKHGTLLTDVGLLISDSQGATVFRKKSVGPMLYVDLPAGDYKVTGLYQGQKQSHKISIVKGGKSQRLILHWAADAAQHSSEDALYDAE